MCVWTLQRKRLMGLGLEELAFYFANILHLAQITQLGCFTSGNLE